MKKIISILIVASMLLFSAVPASCATENDVVNAAKDAGISQTYINMGLNTGNKFSSSKYDKMIEQINLYKLNINKTLGKYFGVSADVFDSSKSKRDADVNFISMSMKEKQDYVSKMSGENKTEFLGSMTNAEKNSCIKQFSTSEMTNILNPLIDFAKTLGFNISIDDISGDVLKFSISDDEGNVIDKSSLGTQTDDVGYDYKMPILLAFAAIILSIGGFIFINKKGEKE